MEISKILTCLCIGFLSIVSLQGQSIDTSVLSTTGNTISNASYAINFTIGETLIGTITNSQSVDQGFWSGIASLNTLSTETFLPSSSSVTIYPNPVSNYFTIRIPDSNHYSISLFDLTGQEVITKDISTSPLGDQIDISSLSQGSYILRLSVSNTDIGNFKIIKQ